MAAGPVSCLRSSMPSSVRSVTRRHHPGTTYGPHLGSCASHLPTLADAILARDYGWESVRGPGPMTWRERATSLQLAAEERHGAPVRARVLAAVAQEDAAAQQSREAAE